MNFTAAASAAERDAAHSAENARADPERLLKRLDSSIGTLVDAALEKRAALRRNDCEEAVDTPEHIADAIVATEAYAHVVAALKREATQAAARASRRARTSRPTSAYLSEASTDTVGTASTVTQAGLRTNESRQQQAQHQNLHHMRSLSFSATESVCSSSSAAASRSGILAPSSTVSCANSAGEDLNEVLAVLEHMRVTDHNDVVTPTSFQHLQSSESATARTSNDRNHIDAALAQLSAFPVGDLVFHPTFPRLRDQLCSIMSSSTWPLRQRMRSLRIYARLLALAPGTHLADVFLAFIRVVLAVCEPAASPSSQGTQGDTAAFAQHAVLTHLRAMHAFPASWHRTARAPAVLAAVLGMHAHAAFLGLAAQIDPHAAVWASWLRRAWARTNMLARTESAGSVVAAVAEIAGLGELSNGENAAAAYARHWLAALFPYSHGRLLLGARAILLVSYLVNMAVDDQSACAAAMLSKAIAGMPTKDTLELVFPHTQRLLTSARTNVHAQRVVRNLLAITDVRSSIMGSPEMWRAVLEVGPGVVQLFAGDLHAAPASTQWDDVMRVITQQPPSDVSDAILKTLTQLAWEEFVHRRRTASWRDPVPSYALEALGVLLDDDAWSARFAALVPAPEATIQAFIESTDGKGANVDDEGVGLGFVTRALALFPRGARMLAAKRAYACMRDALVAASTEMRDTTGLVALISDHFATPAAVAEDFRGDGCLRDLVDLFIVSPVRSGDVPNAEHALLAVLRLLSSLPHSVLHALQVEIPVKDALWEHHLAAPRRHGRLIVDETVMARNELLGRLLLPPGVLDRDVLSGLDDSELEEIINGEWTLNCNRHGNHGSDSTDEETLCTLIRTARAPDELTRMVDLLASSASFATVVRQTLVSALRDAPATPHNDDDDDEDRIDEGARQGTRIPEHISRILLMLLDVSDVEGDGVQATTVEAVLHRAIPNVRVAPDEAALLLEKGVAVGLGVLLARQRLRSTMQCT